MVQSQIMELLKDNYVKKQSVSINKFKQLYNVLKNKMPEDGEEEFVRSHDLTPLIYEVIEDVIDAGELLNWGVRGEVISGKSTIMGKLTEYGNSLLAKKKILQFNYIENKYNVKMKDMKGFDNFEYVVGDQIEFINVIKKALWNCFMGVDEFNKLGETGVNSSVEAILLQTYSDVFAQQKVHRISCAPSVISDANCWLILEVLGKDVEKKLTRVKVVYRDIVTQEQLAIGHADIDVSDVIDKPWYKKYIKKKFNRMKLLQKHSIRKVSELETARIILSIYHELEDRARIMRVDADVVLSISKEVIRRYKYVCSIVAEGDIVSGARSLLSMETGIGKLKKALKREMAQKEEKRNPGDIKIIKQSIKKDGELLAGMIKNYDNLDKIYKEYLSLK